MELLALSFQVTRAVEDFATLIFLSKRRPLYQEKRWLCKNWSLTMSDIGYPQTWSR